MLSVITVSFSEESYIQWGKQWFLFLLSFDRKFTIYFLLTCTIFWKRLIKIGPRECFESYYFKKEMNQNKGIWWSPFSCQKGTILSFSMHMHAKITCSLGTSLTRHLRSLIICMLSNLQCSWKFIFHNKEMRNIHFYCADSKTDHYDTHIVRQ